MDFEPFDWDPWDDDDGNVQHVLRHGIDPTEVEEALLDPNRVADDAYNVGGGTRRSFIGATEVGRILFSVFTYRGERIRVVTARDATDSAKRRYRRRSK